MQKKLNEILKQIISSIKDYDKSLSSNTQTRTIFGIKYSDFKKSSLMKKNDIKNIVNKFDENNDEYFNEYDKFTIFIENIIKSPSISMFNKINILNFINENSPYNDFDDSYAFSYKLDKKLDINWDKIVELYKAEEDLFNVQIPIVNDLVELYINKEQIRHHGVRDLKKFALYILSQNGGFEFFKSMEKSFTDLDNILDIIIEYQKGKLGGAPNLEVLKNINGFRAYVVYKIFLLTENNDYNLNYWSHNTGLEQSLGKDVIITFIWNVIDDMMEEEYLPLLIKYADDFVNQIQDKEIKKEYSEKLQNIKNEKNMQGKSKLESTIIFFKNVYNDPLVRSIIITLGPKVFELLTNS